MKIGIMGAMPEEVAHIKAMMKLTGESTTIAKRTYYEGSIGEKEVVLVYCRWGKVASSSTVTTLIDRFASDFIIFTGVAGAVNKDLNVGDVVIGDALYQHDMDARPIFERFQVPLTDHKLFKPAPEHVQKAKTAAESFLEKIKDAIDEPTLTKFSILEPKVHVGTVASGDQFVANPATHESLKFPGHDVLAVEMEGAAVAQVCEEHKKPYIVIRTISDKADHSAVVDFQNFVQDVASQYSAGIVREFMSLP